MNTLTGVIVGALLVIAVIFGVIQYQKNNETREEGTINIQAPLY